MPWACGRTSPHAARAEPRDTRAAAPPPAHATLANGGDRAPRRDAGAVAAGSVRRYLDAHDGVPARVARAAAPAVHDRQGDGDAADAAPRHAARLCAHPGGLPLGDETGEAARPVGARARSRGPVTSAEALAHLESEYGLAGVDARRAWQTARLAAHIVHHHETALWQPRNEQRFVAIEEPEAHVPVEARAEIFRRYLAAFGPSTRRDIGAWSMIRMAEIDAALELLEPLRRFRDEQGRELLDVPRAPLPDAETPAPVRFLPKWDNVLLAWADRTRVLPEPYRKTVIKVNGDVAQTFLVDGFVAGIWRVDDGRVVLEPFEPLSAAARREIEDEAGRLEAFLAEP